MSQPEPSHEHPVVVIAPDSFKGSLNAPDVAAAIATGFRDVVGSDATLLERPMADGGEGTLDALLRSWDVAAHSVTTVDAIGRRATARYGISPDGGTGVVELAEASGLPAVSDTEPRPLVAHTVGTGELARAVIEQGVDEVLLCIGGSASTDGGVGILTGLGARFRDADGSSVTPGGGTLHSITELDTSGLHPRAQEVRWRIAVDVTNPLTGPNGAAAVYGPQKGADPGEIEALDNGLGSLARVLQTGRHHGHHDLVTTPGMGAAGGVPLSMVAILGAEITPGATLVAEALGLPELLPTTDVVVTGEGRLDQQSLTGKVVGTLATLAAGTTRRATVVVLAGSIDCRTDELRSAGVDAAFSIANGPASLSELTRDCAPLLRQAAASVAGLIVTA